MTRRRWGYVCKALENARISPASILGISFDATTMTVCALNQNGNVVCWGDNTYGQTTAPRGPFGMGAVAAGHSHTCDLDGDGSMVCAGSNGSGESTPPAGLHADVGAGAAFSCARTRCGASE